MNDEALNVATGWLPLSACRRGSVGPVGATVSQPRGADLNMRAGSGPPGAPMEALGFGPGQTDSGISQTDTWDVLSPVNGSRVQVLHRLRSRIPASWAIRSSSDGQT